MKLDHLLRQIVEVRPERVWVVGGAVRDRLLGREAKDLDLVIADIASPLLDPHHWRQQGVAAFWLDEQRHIVRLELAGETLDLAAMEGDDLASDLARRDFTVNAMASRLADWLVADGADPIDPYQGQADLLARRLRLVQPDGMAADPVRILRAGRFQAQLDLRPDTATVSAIAAACPDLTKAPAERVWAELAELLRHQQAAQVLLELERWGVVMALFPEVMAMKRVGQNQHHQFTVDVHSERAFAAYVDVIHQGRYLPDSVRSFVAAYWQDLQPAEQAALMLAAWLHDIGKPQTRMVRDGKVTFYEHEHVGASMAESVAKRLKLSQTQTKLIHTFVTYHMYPMQLWRTGRLDERLIHRLYRRTGRLGVAIVLFTLADHLAKGEQVGVSDEFRSHQQVVEQMLQAYFCRHEQVVAPRPWLTGDEIAQTLGKPRGPWVGETKAALLEAQAAGQVNDRQQALQFVRQYTPRQKRQWRS